MNRIIGVLFAAFALTACGGDVSGPTNSKAGDPSLLITNRLQNDWVYITWNDGLAVEGRDSVAPGTFNQCVRFLAQPDSAKWIITASENGLVATVGGVFFNPASRPAWSVDVSSFGATSSPHIDTRDVAVAC